MAVNTTKRSMASRERRIIERPRLMKMLDETDARVILLIAPAGYGKTTLARQWGRSLSGAISLTLTPAHRDLATIADEVGAQLQHVDEAAQRFLAEFVRARSNPQRAPREIAGAVATQIVGCSIKWLVLDDYHEISIAGEAEEFFRLLLEQTDVRALVSSRVRPRWATSRRLVYEELYELRREDLALTEVEATAVMGQRADKGGFARLAQGWPAVVALASRLPAVALPTGALPPALYQYLAEELFASAPASLRSALMQIALLPDLTPSSMESALGASWADTVQSAHELGFIVQVDEPELHPLLRDFLLSKLSDERDALVRVRTAVADAVKASAWEHALDLVMRFKVADLIESVLTAAYQPLVRSGRVGTLSRFAEAIRRAPIFQPTVVDLIEAEIALRDGQFELAVGLAERVREAFSEDHPLASRTGAIIGHSSFFLARFADADHGFEFARRTATDDRDEGEALHGSAVTKIFGERAGAEQALEAMRARRHASPTDLARYLTDHLSFRHFGSDLKAPLHLSHARHALRQVEDPRARTALAYRAAYVLAQRAEYEQAEPWLAAFFEDAERYVLEFALPYARWTEALVHCGLRRFGQADRSIQMVEDAAEERRDPNHQLNARALRARLLLQTGDAEGAVDLMQLEPRDASIPSWKAEYLATRALAHSCVGQHHAAADAADAAEKGSRALEVKMLVAASRAVTAAVHDEPSKFLLELADRTWAWDSALCALRACPPLAVASAEASELRPALEALYRRSNDRALARRSGFRLRATQRPDEVLSPREQEVLELIARGYRNRQISTALYIADSTTKVHVRHILEKLGVHSRSEAVARYEMFARRGANATGFSDP